MTIQAKTWGRVNGDAQLRESQSNGNKYVSWRLGHVMRTSVDPETGRRHNTYSTVRCNYFTEDENRIERLLATLKNGTYVQVEGTMREPYQWQRREEDNTVSVAQNSMFVNRVLEDCTNAPRQTHSSVTVEESTENHTSLNDDNDPTF